MEMQPTPLSDLPPAPLTDHLMQPPSLPDTLFASPETWISSLPSMYAFFFLMGKHIIITHYLLSSNAFNAVDQIAT